jgi:hypothetical protein
MTNLQINARAAGPDTTKRKSILTMSLKHNPKPSSSPTPMLKNSASAPVIYFDGVPAIGAWQGNIELELAARLLMPQRDGNGVLIDMGCVAHLRCSAAAAVALRDSLIKALDLLDKQANHVRNAQDYIDEESLEALVNHRSPVLNN